MRLVPRTCREVTRLVLEREHRQLALVERLGVGFHLRICRMCQRFGGQMRLMDRALAQWRHDAAHDEADEPAA